MSCFSKEFILNYINTSRIYNQSPRDITKKDLLYDYNEVQELYLNEYNHFVFLVGPTKLNKTQMLDRIVSDLMKSGLNRSNITYLDYSCPFIREYGLTDYVQSFSNMRRDDQDTHIVVNEIQLMPDWKREIELLRKMHPHIKLISSCSQPYLIHEHFSDFPDEQSKVIVLSPKNQSNTKHESYGFGVTDDLKYNIRDGFCEIKGMTKEGKRKPRHVIPSIIDGFPVKTIASGAFHHREELLEIVIPDSVEYIGDYAFTKCSNLKRIDFPTKLQYLGECAFLGATSLEHVGGGDEIIHIGNSAFYQTTWLEQQHDDFVTLGHVLYKYRGSSTYVELDQSIQTIGSYAFANTSVEQIDLTYVKQMNEGCFFNCRKLKEVKNYAIDTVKAFSFMNCESLESFRASLINIEQFAFANCIRLGGSIEGVFRIERNAFEKCKKITSICEVEVVDDFAFFEAGIHEIHDIKAIGDFSFTRTTLKNIHLNTIVSIGDYAFSNIKNLYSVLIDERASLGKGMFYKSVNISKAVISGRNILNHYFCGNNRIKDLTVIGNIVDNFNRNSQYLEKLVVRGGNIGNWAFYNNKTLTDVSLACSSLGAWAFAYCSSLKDITLPENLDYIDMNCFRYCHALRNISILNAGVMMFGANALYSTHPDKRILVKNRDIYLEVDIWREYLASIIEYE